jgi:excisionase family DNA binding protein
MYTVKSAAEHLSVCPSIVYDLVGSGALPHFRIGKNGTRGAIRIAEADLEAYLARQKREKGPEVMPPAPKPPRKKTLFRHIRVN